jgi:2-polyprenyl-6-methoxyphenol hydroxylase-like FAD-dependent oxidoreductase
MNSKQHAIVIGGSIAGLLAARALSDHFDRVTVIERDALPDKGDFRAGVPQARHLHTLLVRGQHIMEHLFPGFTQDLMDVGAPTALWGKDNAFYTTGGWTPEFDSGIVGNICGRAELEWLVRRRVYAVQNIAFLTECEVHGLLADQAGTAVSGVVVESRADHSRENLSADLVVDASGRGSQAAEWLSQLGYDAPQETVIDAHCGYATRWYERPAHADKVALGIQPRPKEGLYRGGALLEVEGKRWVVTLLGANRDYPPTDEAGFLEFARTLPSPVIYEAIKDAKPISGIRGYQRLENCWRHYERLSRRPENFIVMGDAACALNPIYGQGMSSAALQAEMLGELLRTWRGGGLDGFAAQFQKRLATIMQGPWMISTAEDLRYPDVTGAKPNLVTRLSNRYFDLMALAMPYDKVVTTAFFETMNMLRPPTSTMRPAVALRVLWHVLVTRRLSAGQAKRDGQQPSAVQAT